MVKNPPANAGDAREEDLIPGSGRSPEVGHGNPRPVSLPGNPHGQRSLVGYSPWSHKESDILSTHHFILSIHNLMGMWIVSTVDYHE